MLLLVLSVMATERKCFLPPGFSIPSGDTHHTHQMASIGVPKRSEDLAESPLGQAHFHSSTNNVQK